MTPPARNVRFFTSVEPDRPQVRVSFRHIPGTTARTGNATAAAVDMRPRNLEAVDVRRLLLVLLAATALACHHTPAHEYPRDLVDNFLAACRSNGGSDDACRCALDGIQNRFSAEEYAALEKRVKENDEAATRLLTEVVTDCRD